MSSEVFMRRRKYIFDENIRKVLISFKLVPLGVIVGAIIVFCYYDNIKNKKLSQIFNGVDDCIINNPTRKIECKNAYYNALTEAAQTAPRYNSKSACESDFGISQCIKSPESFMPIMSGFSLKKTSNSNTPIFIYKNPDSSNYGGWLISAGYKTEKSIFNKCDTFKNTYLTRELSRGILSKSSNLK